METYREGNEIRNKPTLRYIVHNNDVVGSLEVVQLMRDQHARGVPQVSADALVEELAAHVRVHGRQGVVQQVYFGLVTEVTLKNSFIPTEFGWEFML